MSNVIRFVPSRDARIKQIMDGAVNPLTPLEREGMEFALRGFTDEEFDKVWENHLERN